jgi:plastocyanin
MKKSYGVMLVVLLVICSFLLGTALRESAAAEGQKENVIEMKASDYKFDPDTIKARQGDTLVFKIENVTKKKHNFTVKDPQGKKIQSVDLPANQTVEVSVSFPEAGTYPFNCDKPFHTKFGMKGQVVVAAQ